MGVPQGRSRQTVAVHTSAPQGRGVPVSGPAIRPRSMTDRSMAACERAHQGGPRSTLVNKDVLEAGHLRPCLALAFQASAFLARAISPPMIMCISKALPSPSRRLGPFDLILGGVLPGFAASLALGGTVQTGQPLPGSLAFPTGSAILLLPGLELLALLAATGAAQ